MKMTNKTTAREQASRTKILLAAAKQLAQNPGTSMSEIAKVAGVGRATLHRYFAKREDLQRELVMFALTKTRHIIDEVVALEGSGKTQLDSIILQLIPQGDLFHFLMTDSTLYTNADAYAFYQQQLNSMMAIVEQAKNEQDIASHINSVWVVYALDALLYSAWQGVNEGYIAINDAAGFVSGTLFHGITNPPAGAFSAGFAR
ncbi:MAG: AcrR family transcriptional regulator [Phenylobacterium sp.]|jgi:AcrR family transcriptional regulator